MKRGWIFDVHPDYENNLMVLWIKTNNGIERLTDEFYPTFYVHGNSGELEDLRKRLEILSSIKDMRFEDRKIQLGKQRETRVLSVTMAKYGELNNTARLIDASGKYRDFQLYNVDFELGQRYLLERSVFPLAHVETADAREFRLLDDQWSLDYEVPVLKSVDLSVSVSPQRRIPGFNDSLSKIHIDDITLEGEEPELLLELVETIKGIDPDIIYTDDGDTFALPYLYHRAEVNNVLDDFQLGREKQSSKATRKGKSYFTYGQIRYRPPFYGLKGRIHIDRESSFTFTESDLHGLIEISRISGIPLQRLSRVTPGTGISAMQVNQAVKDGYLVLWKKNIPERFKTAEELLLSDRGGFIYEPKVGIHDGVVEVDFVSLYPSIMVKYNISPETILCDCCPDSKILVPKINYHICERKTGLIPTVLKPIIERRIEYKRLKKEEMYRCRASALKWVLVTCFGYTGYKNARFGRIECHEAINGYGRDIILQASEIAEMYGYEIIHGIVDSLWLKPNGYYDHEKLVQRISKYTGLPISIEGVYKWIVFLRNKGNNAGALNRYYGLFENGELKIRGIELRRHDSPQLVRDLQNDSLKILSTANNSKEFIEKIPAVIGTLKQYARKIICGDYPLEDLVLTKRVSRGLYEHEQFNDQVAALTQLVDEGVSIHPGEMIRYILCDNSRNHKKRVKIAELIDGNEEYDVNRYVEVLARGVESMLQPFGYDMKRLLGIIYSDT